MTQDIPALIERPTEAEMQQVYDLIINLCEHDSERHKPGSTALKTLNRLFALTRPDPDSVEREAIAKALEPYANHNGPLPDYDSPIAGVFDSGVQYAVELLAKELGVDDWTPCDGTEEYDGDLGGTMMNIVRASLPTDEHGEHLWPSEVHAALRAPAPDGWLPIDSAPLNTPVELRVGSMTLMARLVPDASMTSEEVSCDQWQAEHEGEHPPCWSGGACWETNEDGVSSLQPTAWRAPSNDSPEHGGVGA